MPIEVVLITIIILLIGACTGLASQAPVEAMPLANRQSSGLYWFHAGAHLAGSEEVTGGSVEIRVNYNQRVLERIHQLYYWVGLDLPGSSFIQVGYVISTTSNYPMWFWAYFLHNAYNASPSWCNLACPYGEEIGPNGTWYKFTLQSTGTIWSVYVNGIEVGHVDLGVSSSRGSNLYAMAEDAGTTHLDDTLGPVEFRNLSYRDLDGIWHLAPSGTSDIGYSTGSATAPWFPNYSLLLIPGKNNYWVAGSVNCTKAQDCIISQSWGAVMWPWYYVTVNDSFGASGWYLEATHIGLTPPPRILVNQTTRKVFDQWMALNDPTYRIYGNSFQVVENVTIVPRYVTQFYVNATSVYGVATGSGWYTEGSNATVSVNPLSFQSGFLGPFPVMTQFDGWTGSMNDSRNPAVFPVEGPMTVRTLWISNYEDTVTELITTIGSILLIVTISVLVVCVHYHRRSKKL